MPTGTGQEPPLFFLIQSMFGSTNLWVQNNLSNGKTLVAHKGLLGKLQFSMENGTIQSIHFIEISRAKMRKLVHSLSHVWLSATPWRASLIAQSEKNLPAMQETRVRFLGQEDPLEKEMATHSSVIARRILWTEEPGRLQFMGSQESDMKKKKKSRTRLSD